ncbi:MAG: hypothetical protein Kow0025_08210 [Thermodesulfovibrionales bacterium]
MGEKILVLDDEPLVLSTVQRALGKVGYQVTATGDPAVFLDALSAGDSPLLIMDLHVEGADVRALAEEAMRLSPRSKILFISGSVPEGAEDGHFLEKPFRIEELRQKVRGLLDAP